MRITITLFTALLLLAFGRSEAQTPKDATIPVTATVNFFPANIRLEWPVYNSDNLLLLRRTKGQTGTQWVPLMNANNTTLSSYTDNNVVVGQTYEYALQRSYTYDTLALFGFGYAHVSVRSAVTDNRGKILVFVDSTTADAIGVELVRMKNDMRGDGWIAIPKKVGPSATPQSVKAQIVQEYNADPQNVKAVLLIGSVPVPYSGDTNWDLHPDHAGAWPADSYYADVNGNWTDATINDTSPGRDANDNVPGDGKFDQSVIPSAVELQVGRVDFRRLDAAAFGEADVIGLIRRYLDKDHAWRTGQYEVENKALVDDNFGFFNGEVFAANGYRNAYPLTGAANVVEGDFINDSKSQKWLMGYGCGGGNYQGAGGIGSSTDFATETVNIVFTGLFGSYFGDWDYESNPFMPAALASRGGILTCSWVGRPHMFFHQLASGETIGYCQKENLNSQYNNGFYGSFGESGTHVALLGDPTLRAHVVKPPTNITASANCTNVVLNWTASTDQVEGYHVYRSFSNDGPYTRISVNLVNGTSFTDNNAPEDTLFYQVRAIKLQTAPAGGLYLNNSVGPIISTIFQTSTPPTVQVSGGDLNCAQFSVQLEATSDKPIASWQWFGPDNFNSTESSPVVFTPGNYSVVATDVNGCTAVGETTVGQNTISPVLTVVSSGVLTCENQSSTLTVNSAVTLDPGSFVWSTGETTPSITVAVPGVYTVTANALQNGCPGEGSVSQTQNVQLPNFSLPAQLAYNCISPCVLIELPQQNQYAYTLDGEPVTGTSFLEFCTPGQHTLNTTGIQNGCTQENTFEIVADLAEPGAAIGGNTYLTCDTPFVQLLGSASIAEVLYQWSGPGITPITANQQNPTIDLPGVYTLTVISVENGCTSTDQVIIQSDVSLPVAFASGGTLNCLIGSVVLSGEMSSVGPDITYAWSGPDGFFSTELNPTTTFPGEYTLVVTSGSACSAVATATVIEDRDAPDPGQFAGLNIDCNHACAVLQWDPAQQFLEISPDTICAPGTYELMISNPNNGCTSTRSITVVEAPELSGAFEPFFLDCDGTITLTILPSGGTPPYAYLWSNGSTFQSALYLLNGSPITVTITDAAGCVWGSTPLIVTPAPPIVVASTVVDESGPGQHDGAISLSLTGGTPPFSLDWSNGATGSTITGLAGGTYTVTVTELTTGCTSEYTFVVNTASGTNESEMFRKLTLSPNPSSGYSQLQLELFASATVRIRLHDALGRLISESQASQTSNLTYGIDLTKETAGVYQVSILIDNQTFMRKLVLVK